jgi:hypothetical protein
LKDSNRIIQDFQAKEQQIAAQAEEIEQWKAMYKKRRECWILARRQAKHYQSQIAQLESAKEELADELNRTREAITGQERTNAKLQRANNELNLKLRNTKAAIVTHEEKLLTDLTNTKSTAPPEERRMPR